MSKKVVSIETIHEQKFASLSRAYVEQSNGSVKKELFLKKDDAVSVTIVDIHTEKVLFVRQFRSPVSCHSARGEYFNPYNLEPVAGHIEEGHTPEQTAIKEVEEETTLSISDLTFIGKGFTSPGISTEVHYHYVAKFDSSKVDMKDLLNKVHGIDDEEISIELIPLDKAMEMVQTGEICSSHALVGLFYLNGMKMK